MDILLPADQRFNHLASRYPQHITGHRAQFDVGGLQHLLDAIVDGISLLDQLGLLAGQIPSSRCWRSGTKLGLNSPHCNSCAIHSASFMSVFLPGTFLMCWALTTHT